MVMKIRAAEKMFQPATITGGGFHGVVNGLGSTEQKFYTKMSAPNIFGETPMRWLLASEVAFLKAEFKLLKGDKSGAKSDYEEGIRLSFLENGLSASDAADYAQSMKTPARFIGYVGKSDQVFKECIRNRFCEVGRRWK